MTDLKSIEVREELFDTVIKHEKFINVIFRNGEAEIGFNLYHDGDLIIEVNGDDICPSAQFAEISRIHTKIIGGKSK